MKTTLLLLIVLLLTSGCSREERDIQTSTVGALDTSATSEPLSKEVGRTMIEADEFAERAIQGGLTELVLAEMAIARSPTAEVRSLAQTITQDHRSANERLLRVLDEMSIEPPEAPSPEQKETIDRLSSLSGDQFDHEYVQALVESHEKSVEMYQQVTGSDLDPALQNYAVETVPALLNHLRRAKALEDQLKK